MRTRVHQNILNIQALNCMLRVELLTVVLDDPVCQVVDKISGDIKRHNHAPSVEAAEENS